MNIKHIYTKDDAFQDKDGQWAIDFTLPTTGDGYRITASSPQHVADSVNQQIRMTLRQYDAEQPYREAVQVLSKMCLVHDGSGAYAAAQVLLSTYNGNNYHVDLTDLCSLDEDNLRHAMAVINGRVCTFREPHNMIENGSKIFDELEEKWGHLSVYKRYEKYQR